MEIDEKVEKYFQENREKMMKEMPEIDPSEAMKNFEPPSMDEMLKILESIQGISDEDREMLRQDIMAGPLAGSHNVLKQKARKILTQPDNSDYLVFIVMISIVVLIFGS